MPKTLFRPRIDGSAFEFSDAISKKEFDDVRRTFESAIDDALDVLKTLYNAALEIYDIRNNLLEAVADDIPQAYILHCGIIYFTLDYYNARRFYPRSINTHQESLVRLQSFFRSRALDNIEANAGLLLHNTAIAYMIPDKWLPESWLIDPIKDEIKKMKTIKDSSIDLSLRVPSGGNIWLKNKCRQEWDKLTAYIDDGRPWPIRLIGASQNPYQNEAVIAYGYKETGDGTGKIDVYDPGTPGQKQILKLRFHGKTQISVESFTGLPVDNIRGFYCENYTHVVPPTGDGFQARPLWYMGRWMKLFWLWAKSM